MQAVFDNQLIHFGTQGEIVFRLKFPHVENSVFEYFAEQQDILINITILLPLQEVY